MKKLSLCLSVFLLGFGTLAQAGTAKFSGSARVDSDADYVELRVNVASECFDKAVEVSQANDDMAIEVMNILKEYTEDQNEHDKVLATGGYVQRYTGYDPRLREPVCVRTFKKNNAVTLRTSKVNEFAQIFAEIQDKIYGMQKDRPESISSPTTYVTMSQPSPRLLEETRKIMEKQALKIAVDEALAKAEVVLGAQGISRWVITEMKESFKLVIPNRHNSDELGRAPQPAPIAFDKLWVRAEVQINLSY